MKKIITVLMVLMVATSMFAYMPKKKNIEKYGEWIVYGHKYKDIYRDKKTNYISYNTKTGEIYFQHYEDLEYIKKTYSPDLQKILIKNIEKMWERTDNERETYRMFTEIAEDYKNKYHKKALAKDRFSFVKEIEKQFLDDYPFFTKENWKTLTKEEWNKMAKDFLENN